MSKEQTPIEELRLEIIKHLPNNPDAVFSILSKANKATQSKVLEALEREFTIVSLIEFRGTQYIGEDYLETEVKPKYEQ